MKDIHIVRKKMTRSGLKMAIYYSQILGNTLYVPVINISYFKSTDYINEFTVRDKKGFGELKGCIGKIRFEPGFQRGNVFE